MDLFLSVLSVLSVVKLLFWAKQLFSAKWESCWIFFSLQSTAALELEAAINSAIGQDGLPGDVRSAFRGEPDNHVRDLFGITESFHRSFRRPSLAALPGRAARGQRPDLRQLLQALRRGEARGHVVHQDSIFAELIAEALDQPHHGRAH